MLRWTVVLLALTIPAGHKLATRYAESPGVRVSARTSIKMETTRFELERDGERIEGMRAPSSSELERSIVHVDRVVAQADGRPTHVERTFEELSCVSTARMGDEEISEEADPSLRGVKLSLEAGEDGEVSVKVVEGDEPSDDGALEGHRLELALDELLPDGEVELGDDWDLDAADVRRLLVADLHAALFPPKAEEEPSDGGGRRRGMGRGPRSGVLTRAIADAEWTGEAKLVSVAEDKDGVACALIEFEAKAEGDLPEPQRGGRGGVFEPPASGLRVESTFSIELEGKLWFALEDARPVALESSATVETESDTERPGRDGGTMRIRSKQEGRLEHKVEIAKVD